LKRRLIDYGYLTSSVVGAALVASNTGTQVVGFSIFLVSNILGIMLLRGTTASKSLVWVNLIFASINVMGIVRYVT
jgi:hypothetical protein